MTKRNGFREAIRGESSDFRTQLLRALLRPLATPYSLAVRWRNTAFDNQRKKVHQAKVPVISIGNLTVGGTGKTPMVSHVVKHLLSLGQNPVILSRGYGAKRGTPNDEAMMLADELPGIVHLQGKNRSLLADEAVRNHKASVLVLDDGFQHRQLHRDLDIVLIDATDPFGGCKMLPAGLLREPLESLLRADIIVLTRCDSVRKEELAKLTSQIEAIVDRPPDVAVRFTPRCLLRSGGVEKSLQILQHENVIGFCGIGNPLGFRKTIERLGVEVRGFRAFPDHHSYTGADLASLSQWCQEMDPAAVLTTHKDLVKLRRTNFGQTPLYAVAIAPQILSGRSVLENGIEKLFTGTRHSGRAA